ncbi:MAG TPA: hypothetical protein VLL04_08250, partial [Rhizomicrobium sp.]|nr:hypothetical protein [Rhizomicrobium sp.]
MTRALLVARSEFLKYVTRRGFIISLLMFPVWVVVGGVVPQWIESKTPTRSFTVVDRTGGAYAFAVAKAVNDDAEGADRDALSAYAQNNIDMASLRKKMPAIAIILDAPSGDAQSLKDFRNAGGANGVLSLIEPFRSTKAVFVAPRPRFHFVSPGQLGKTSEGSFASAANARLSGNGALYAVVSVPRAFSGA